MILADTSVWVDHFRKQDAHLHSLLLIGQILMHPFVTGELALGSLRNRAQTLHLLDHLPQVRVAGTDEVRHFIDARSLQQRGIGYVDAHLLASVLITPSALLWTRDRRLRKVAEDLQLHTPLR